MGQRGAERLGTAAMLFGVTRVPILVVPHCCQVVLFFVREAVHRGGIGRNEEGIQMDAVAVFGVLKGDRGCYSSTPIPALRVISLGAQTQHQLTPGARDLFYPPAVLPRVLSTT